MLSVRLPQPRAGYRQLDSGSQKLYMDLDSAGGLAPLILMAFKGQLQFLTRPGAWSCCAYMGASESVSCVPRKWYLQRKQNIILFFLSSICIENQVLTYLTVDTIVFDYYSLSCTIFKCSLSELSQACKVFMCPKGYFSLAYNGKMCVLGRGLLCL